MADTRLKIAVFIDFDNIEIGVKNTLGVQFDIGVVLEALKERGMLCKETHDFVLRLSPPLVTSRSDLSWAVTQLRAVFSTA